MDRNTTTEARPARALDLYVLNLIGYFLRHDTLTGNVAYIDGQNLYQATKSAPHPWVIDLPKFRLFLSQEFDVKRAYYFMGFKREGGGASRLYRRIRDAGFTLVFRESAANGKSRKKGNVDTAMIFSIMRSIHQGRSFNKLVLVTGDGDFKPVVEFLIDQGRFAKLLMPSIKRGSSLFRDICHGYKQSLSHPEVRQVIQK